RARFSFDGSDCMAEVFSPGLEGVIAGETAISTLEGGLSYRGYPVVELVERCVFEEVAYLLLHGELPTKAQLDDFIGRLIAMSSLSPHATDFLEHVPSDSAPMDLLRSAVSLLAHGDPDERAGESADLNMRRSERLLAQIPTVLGHIAAVRDGIAVTPRPELGIAGNLMWLVTGEEPTAEGKKAFDVSLI